MKLTAILDSTKRLCGKDNQIQLGTLIGVTIVFTLILYPSVVAVDHSYRLGDIAKRDIKAPTSFLITDEAETEKKRQQAMEAVKTLYDHDTVLASRLAVQIESAFDDLRALFNLSPASPEEATGSAQPLAQGPSVHEQVQQMKGAFEDKIGIPISKGAYRILERERFSTEISDLIVRILTEILDNGVVENKEFLLAQAVEGIVLRDIATKGETVVYQVKGYYGLDQAKTMVRVKGDPLLRDVGYTLRNLAVDFVQLLVQPNITQNRSATEERRNAARDEVKDTLYEIKAGEMILRKGDRVTAQSLVKLDALRAETKKADVLPRILGAAMILLSLMTIIYFISIDRHSGFSRDPNKNLLLIAILLVTFFFFARISASLTGSLTPSSGVSIPAESLAYGIPLAAGAMLVCLFMGIDLAIPFAMVTAVGAAIIFTDRFEIFLYFFVTGIMAAYWVQDCRERKVFIKAGLKLGLLNLLLAAVIRTYLADLSWEALFWDSVFAFVGGIATGVLAAGFTPLIEVSFTYTTDIKLLELANLDQPILRRLMLEAPGTYHHSVTIGTMVEAAASEINANPLLAKVCGYYHDIGKIKKPQYFIENQPDSNNKHDKLAPPMSKRVLISHVKDGVELARKNKLGQVILDTIQQHHGTSVISYLYEKAKQRNGGQAVDNEDYRYPGPKPQTKEAGLVLLADVVEAASRTLENPTPSRVQGQVQSLIDSIFSAGQLDDCELTLKDLTAIKQTFTKILNGIHHHRIEYSENAVSEKADAKNGSSDRKQAEQAQSSSGRDSSKDRGNIRRLGVP